VLLGVHARRAPKSAASRPTPELINDAQAFAKFQAAQGQLTSSLSRLAAGGGKLSATEIRREFPATCRRNWKARKTASPWRATATSRRCRNTTLPCALSRAI